ncbi:MAG: phosphopentomutase [Rhizobiaceae bacterium]|jgi:phosphopentomutase|nr:phosphopentomutase [Rhizobiaceae bacterium]
MARAHVFILDSFGIGGAPDAAAYGDAGADTYGHIRAACAKGDGDRAGVRQGPLHTPNMLALGLGHAHALAAGAPLPAAVPSGFFAAAAERSRGKDTPSGHWEIAGLPVPFKWTFFPREEPAFPAALLNAICNAAGVPGSLCNTHGSGTDVIARFGEEHMLSGKPIFYTSSDSVFQIAAHEDSFGLKRLYDLCETAFALTAPMKVGRVIARPFTGTDSASFRRTANRRDFAIPPPEPTLLDRLVAAGRAVHAVGKIGDIFAHRGITRLTKASGNMALFDAALAAMGSAAEGDMTFTNFVDFDMEYGHRRDVPGYAAALEAFDSRLPEALARLQNDDLLILTADHGCDPTWPGTDHTREMVPVFGKAPGQDGTDAGRRASFADIGATIAQHLGIAPGPHGMPLFAPPPLPSSTHA